MRRLGVFAKTFVRPTVEEVFDAVAALKLGWVQFNYACAGLPTLPESVDPDVIRRTHQAAHGRGIQLAALSGTFNLIHPDPAQRADGLRRLRVLATSCAGLHTPLITLCTGTRDPDNMWRAHPDNASSSAWRDLTRSLEAALKMADEFALFMGVEPETGNVMSSAAHARRLLDEMASPRLKVILDPANLMTAGTPDDARAAMDAAFDLVGQDLGLVHAKEWDGNQPGSHGRLGAGALDWDRYGERLRQSRYSGPIIMHGFEEPEAASSTAFLRDKWAAMENN